MKQNWKKNAAIFVGSQVLSLFGSSLVQYAITWHITLTTKSGVYATLIIVCGILPIFFLAPFAGVWADRYNRKLLIVLADAGIALCTLILAILFMSGYNAVWLIFVASGIRALGSAVQYPAVGAMLPDLVPEEQLTRVNGIYGSLQSLITLVSPMLSGALLSMASIESVFFVDVSTAAIAIMVMLTFLQVPTRPGDTRRSSGDYLQELRLGIRYIGATSASILSTLEPITSVVLGILVLGESVSPLKLTGCALILVSVICIARSPEPPGHGTERAVED